jgi:DNA-binding CsgD family transcriptional regulator/tetratricopeptide (TPR) repeat protein
VLLGRDGECAAIDGLLDGARASRSGALVLRGEAGIGKSALLDYAVRKADGMRVLTGSGVQTESELPFAGMHQLLWPLLDRANELPDVQAAALRGAFGLSADRVDDRFLVSAAMLGLLTTVADDEPMVCVVDDAHWLDDASADALVFTARRLQADPVALVVAAREGDARTFDAPGLPELRLGGLQAADAAALLDGKDSLPMVVREQLVEATGGNPLALLELPGALTDDERAGRAPLRPDLPLAERIERAFLARVEPLPENARRLLLLAAADDTGDTGTVLRAASTLDIDAAALDTAEKAGLLTTDRGLVRFRHPLVRSAVYRDAPFGERRAAHEALAAALSDDANADRAAWHRAVVATPPDDAVAEVLAATADRARHRGGYAAAERALERAAELGSDPVRRTDRLLAAAAAAALAGRPGRSEALLDRATPGIAEPTRQAEAARIRSQIEIAVGRPGEAHAVVADAARAVLPIDRRAGLELLAMTRTLASISGDFDAQVEASRIAAEIDPDPGDAEELFVVRLMTGFAKVIEGDAAAGAPLLEEALAVAESFDDPLQLDRAAAGAFILGDWVRALRFRDLAVRIARDRGALGLLPHILGFRAAVTLWDRRLADAATDASEGLRLAEDIGAENARAMPLAVLAWIAGLRGDEPECRRRAEGVLRLSLDRGLALPAGLATWALAQLDLALGRWDEAIARLIALEDQPYLRVISAWDRVEAAIHTSNAEVAGRAVDLFAEWARGAAPPWATPVLADCRALTAPAEQADAHFEAAMEAIDGARPLDRARIHLHYGEHLRRERRRIDARVHLREAFDGFDRLGVEPWAERARRELRATGETARKRDVSPLAELTPQELQVARLVGEGATNKAVAAQLFVSPKTVEYHLRKVFAKLGIASRTELIRLELGEQAGAQQPA